MINIFDINKLDKEVIKTLLKDKTTNKNIIWASNDYEDINSYFVFENEINYSDLYVSNNLIIQPRVFKLKSIYENRTKIMGEVFTPSWVCNKQNNFVDNLWFGIEGLFNKEHEESWEVNLTEIPFQNLNKSWEDYVLDKRIEISCGEAPYLVSRYDTSLGNEIKIESRIGILDRKLRVVSENTSNEEEWLKWAIIAYKSTYGYEWQGDNLFVARVNLMLTFIEYYYWCFKKFPSRENLLIISEIISWNVFQMDGLKGVIPNSCVSKTIGPNLFGEIEEFECFGCKVSDISSHNGTYVLIKDWEINNSLRYIDVTHNRR